MRAILFVPILFACVGQKEPETFEASDYIGNISADNLQAFTSTLAADSMEGRAVGTMGFERAAQYVAEYYHNIGLSPAGKDDFQQRFVASVKEKSAETSNVIGFVPASRETPESIVVIAHLDHIGVNDTLPGDQIYNGASDNAAGVAACMLLAKSMIQAKKEGAELLRNIVFLNTSGEEHYGMAGARHYVEKQPIFPIDEIVAVINMDGIAGYDSMNLPGNNNFVYVIGEDSTSADILGLNQKINSYATSKLDFPEAPRAFGSDQKVFEGYLVPSIYYSTGLTIHYHQVSDHASTIDYDHTQKIVSHIFNMIWELARHPNPNPSFNREEYVAIERQYVCRPCGCKNHDVIYEKPGTCPSCDMTLIPVWKKRKAKL